MISVGELRLGNYINDENLHPQQVSEITNFNRVCFGSNRIVEDLQNCTPIPLTEELLLKCGFYKVGATFGIKMEAVMYHKSMDGYCLSLLDELGLMFCHCSSCEYAEYDEIMPLCGVNYLYELQNLCFDLTGKELEVSL